jgi:SAM-dependent methyltransferase
VDHSIYDKRKYPIVEVQEGYGERVRTYEQTVQDEMDLRLLERLQTVDWTAARAMLDLACGTGRIGAWLRRRSSAAIDGVDLTPEMLDVARKKGIYRALHSGEVSSTGLPSETYDLCIQSLADEHLPDLQAALPRSGTRDKAWRLFRHCGFSSSVSYGRHTDPLRAGAPLARHNPQLRASLERSCKGSSHRRLVASRNGRRTD